MKILMLIFACLFCLATIPAMADYSCAVETKGCSSDREKDTPGDKAIACLQCECCISGVSISSPSSTTLKFFIAQLPLASESYLKPSCIVGPPLEPPTV